MNLKKIIKEETEDMWQNLIQGEGNIWLSYQMIIFDEIPTKEEVIKLIRDAFKSGFVKKEAIDSWEGEGIENEANIIIRYEVPYLRIDLKEGWLYYGSYGNEAIKNHPELRVINYSEAKDYLVNESEEVGDIEWMKGPVTIRLREVVGDEERMGEYFKKGQKIYATGHLVLNDFDRSMDTFIKDEPAIVLSVHKSLLKVQFIGNVTNNTNWSNMIPNDEIYLGSFNEDLDLIIAIPTDNLNESKEINDFAWVMDEPVNPWLQYSMIIFDVEPTREEINHYIELALNTGRISNKEAWETGREQDINTILRYIRRYDGAILKIDQWGDLQYTDISYYNSSHNAIKYSQLINKNLNESEEDEWAWTKENIFVDEVNMGDRVRVYNTGSEKAFLNWLGGYRQNYLNGEYGEYIEGLVIAEEENDFALSVKGKKYGDTIYFPYKSHIEFLESMDEYKGLSLAYEIISKA